MKLQYALKVATLTMLLASCKKEADAATEAKPVPQQTVIAPIKTKESTLNFIEAFMAKKKQVKAKLSSLSPDEANVLYETYKKENDSSLVILEGYEKNILEKYYSYYTDEQGNAVTPPDSITKKAKLLESAGLEYLEIGEGIVEITSEPKFYLDLFKNRVSPDYKEYIALLAKDDENLYSADAGIVIAFEEVGKRVINWEKFIAKYPYSKVTPRAIELYKMYQDGFLLGMDNTPTIEYSDNTIYPENIKIFKAFMALNPKSPTNALIKILMESEGTKDEKRNIIVNEQDKYIKKLIEDTTPDYY